METGRHARECAISRREITSQHPRGRISLRPQFLRLLQSIHRVVRLVCLRHRVHKVASEAVGARVHDDHCVTTSALDTVFLVGFQIAIAVGVTIRVAGRGAHVLDGCVGSFADPHQKHGFDGRDVSNGLGVVPFGDTLTVAPVEQVMAHYPA